MIREMRRIARRICVCACAWSAARGSEAAKYTKGERVFHEKFGYGVVSAVEGNKLTIDFDKAGEKRVIDSFVARA